MRSMPMQVQESFILWRRPAYSFAELARDAEGTSIERDIAVRTNRLNALANRAQLPALRRKALLSQKRELHKGIPSQSSFRNKSSLCSVCALPLPSLKRRSAGGNTSQGPLPVKRHRYAICLDHKSLSPARPTKSSSPHLLSRTPEAPDTGKPSSRHGPLASFPQVSQVRSRPGVKRRKRHVPQISPAYVRDPLKPRAAIECTSRPREGEAPAEPHRRGYPNLGTESAGNPRGLVSLLRQANGIRIMKNKWPGRHRATCLQSMLRPCVD